MIFENSAGNRTKKLFLDKEDVANLQMDKVIPCFNLLCAWGGMQETGENVYWEFSQDFNEKMIKSILKCFALNKPV